MQFDWQTILSLFIIGVAMCHLVYRFTWPTPKSNPHCQTCKKCSTSEKQLVELK